MKSAFLRRRFRSSFRPRLESLETRLTPTTYTVSSLADSGDGSLRAAITSVNGDTSPDEIDFSVAGVIQLTSGALPTITNTVNINGRSAPGFANAPLVEIDFHGFAGLTLSGSNSTLAGLSIANANENGVTLEGDNITIKGNYIGLALDGSVASNTGVGVLVDHSTGDTIGGTIAADRNFISGNGQPGTIGSEGIALGPSNDIGFQQDATIEGNVIGLDPNGQPVEGQFDGIRVFSSGNTIGGLAPGAGNVFTTGVFGLFVEGSSNSILSNSIYDNQEANIFLDGGNAGQQPPTLFFAIPRGTSTVINGVMNGQANTAYTIQLFASPRDGEGRTFLGTVTATTDTSGSAPFTLQVPTPANAGSFITATATSPAGNTSQFSTSVSLSATPNEAFVASAYGLLLHRAEDPMSSSWVDQLNAGVPPSQVLLEIQASTEYLNIQVTSMYQLYLQRQPDGGGLQFMVNFLQTGGTFEQVAETMTSSQEYFDLHGGTNQGFITGLYHDVLSRNAGDAEIAGWEAVLDAGNSLLFVSTAFLTSQEYRTNLVQSDYITFLLRPADPGGLMTWVGALNAGFTDQQVLAGIFGSTEGFLLWS